MYRIYTSRLSDSTASEIANIVFFSTDQFFFINNCSSLDLLPLLYLQREKKSCFDLVECIILFLFSVQIGRFASRATDDGPDLVT